MRRIEKDGSKWLPKPSDHVCSDHFIDKIVERAINRIKSYRIIKTVLPITMLHHIDDIVRVCAALCNLKPLRTYQ